MSKKYPAHYETKEDYSEDEDVVLISFANGLGASDIPVGVFYIMSDDGELYIKNMKIYEFNLDYYEQIWKSKDIEKINDNYIFVLFNRSEEELNELEDICENSKEFVNAIKEANKIIQC